VVLKMSVSNPKKMQNWGIVSCVSVEVGAAVFCPTKSNIVYLVWNQTVFAKMTILNVTIIFTTRVKSSSVCKDYNIKRNYEYNIHKEKYC
jgi:hypothetical protein